MGIKVGLEERRKSEGDKFGPTQGSSGFMTNIDAQHQESHARIIPRDMLDDAPAGVDAEAYRSSHWPQECVGAHCAGRDRLVEQGYRCMDDGTGWNPASREGLGGELGQLCPITSTINHDSCMASSALHESCTLRKRGWRLTAPTTGRKEDSTRRSTNSGGRMML